MKRIRFISSLILFTLSLWSLVARATEPKKCSQEMAQEHNPIAKDSANYRLVYSGRDEEISRDLAEAAEILFGQGGVSEKLGVAFPDHVVEFTPSAELSALASLGRHAVPHWHDGAQLAQAAKTGGGVLEFVTPGCPTCRSFYSDTTKLEHQISILMHVAGHNDFAAHSKYCISRPCDPVQESLKLADYMEKLYLEYDHDEVSQWYQYLLTTSMLQDLVRGTFEFPQSFAPDTEPQGRVAFAKDAAGYKSRKRPTHPTPSILQAIVTNLPADAPLWKKEMVAHFEKIFRVYGFYTSNKIMNEGWATLMQELMPPYTKYSGSHHAIEFGDLMQGVSGSRLAISNPYWLGREAWRRVRKRFNARPEIRDLDLLQKDRRFIDYAHREIISSMNDYDFLLMALDEQWVFDHKLFLSRPADWTEYDRSLPYPGPEYNEQRIILSRDAKRVVPLIARKVADKRYQLPQLWVEDLAGPTVRLVHETVDDIPLVQRSMAQALYVLAQTLEKPVSLVTVRNISIAEQMRGWPPRWGHFTFGDLEEAGTLMPKANPIRIEVHPGGKVDAYDVSSASDAPEARNAILSEKLQGFVEAYRLDQEGTDNESLLTSQREKFLPMISEVTNHVTKQGMGLLNHSPTGGHALLEFANLIESRILRALELARAGKLKVKSTGKSVRLAVLPIVPEFALDRKAMKEIHNSFPPAPVDGAGAIAMPEMLPKLASFLPAVANPNPDSNSDLGAGNGGKPGDKYWGKKPKKGKGDPDDEDEDGDPDEDGEPDQGNEDGEPQDPSEVEIPKALFAQYFFQNFELPNLTRRSGESEVVDTIREGGVKKPQGQVLWDRTIPSALTYAIEFRRRKGMPYRNIPQAQLLKEGMRFLSPSDYVVSDRSETRKPDMKAVVVYVIDLTGSMSGRPQELSKEWVSYVDWLIAKNYGNAVDTRFVGYDDVAHEFPRNKIFRTFLGGGNTDSKGFEMAEAILSEPKYASNYDCYVFGIGDGGSWDTSATHTAMERLYKRTQYMGWVQNDVRGYGGVQEFVQPMRDMAKNLPWYGYADLRDDNIGVFDSIHEFFKQKKK